MSTGSAPHETASHDAPSGELRRSPLHDVHAGLGAKLADFGGWEMPIEYPDGGVLKEHQAVREAVGVFDVSHLGKATVRGSGAAEFINATLTNDLGKIAPGKAQYTMCCDDATGGVVDDLIAYLVSPDEVFLVPNAANTADVVRRLRAAAPSGLDITDEHERYGVLAVQGPRSDELLAAVGLPTGHAYMSYVDADLDGRPVRVCRSGYTGERGYELLPRWADTETVWSRLLDAGAALGARPCGLGARDTLRTEMGYPLHGHELSLSITPIQARTGWAVGWAKPGFWGRTALLAEKETGPARTLRGLLALERAIPRADMVVQSVADTAGSDAVGAAIGVVTSGTFSPTLRVGIALALLDRRSDGALIPDDTEVVIDVRGRPGRFRVVKPPFVTTTTD